MAHIEFKAFSICVLEESLLRFLKEVTMIIGADGIDIRPQSLTDVATNTLAISIEPRAIIKPTSADQVARIVKIANEYQVALYPISRGMNIGYGESTPTRSSVVVLDLSKLNQIRGYDPVFGEIEVEPGVTQLQIYNYLKEQGDTFIADMTGAPLDASIVGNYLEGGFGHSPIGNRRQSLLEVEVVLSNGEVFKTGRFPNLGPNLASLFIQSNFGVVTSIRIPLMRKPERVTTYIVEFRDADSLERGVEVLRELRQRGVVQSLVHLGNATRLFMSRSRFPEGLSAETILTDSDCQMRMSNALLKPGLWSAVGGIYGSSQQVQAARREFESRFRGVAKIRFFDDKSFCRMKKWIGRLLYPFKSLRTEILSGLDTLESIHGLARGIPTQQPMNNIFWRVTERERLGLIWFCPVISANSDSVRSLIALAQPIFSRHKFEMPMTMTLVDNRHLICVFSINFDRGNPAELERAWALHRELSENVKAIGIKIYRAGLLDNPTDYIDAKRNEVLKRIKHSLDPVHIISPGRYGLK